MNASYDDIPQIVQLAKAFQVESKTGLPFDDVFFSSMVANFIDLPNCCCFKFEKEGVVRGFIMGQISQYPAANILQANELMWYCQKEFRGLGAVKLFKKYKQWAIDNQAKVIFAGAHAGNASKFYKKNGMNMIDENWGIVLN